MKLLTATALYFLVFTPCQGKLLQRIRGITTTHRFFLGAVAGTGHSSFESIPRRALPNAPDGYTPLGADCASNRPVIRNAATLSPNETSWLQRRRNQTVQPMKDLLSRLNLTDFDAAAYISRHANNASAMPNIGIAVSGGGYRALMNGGGALQAFDNRTESATTQGHLGGLLQSSTYLAGLSGGGWLLGSVYINNFTTVTALRDSGSVWAFDNTILEGPNRTGSQTTDTIDYWTNIYDAVAGKNAAGFETSITDYWWVASVFEIGHLLTEPKGSSTCKPAHRCS
jgi:lysophospholipase